MPDVNRGLAALAALVVLAVVLAVAQVGGPARGALEKRDDLRLRDLQRIRDQISCLTDIEDAPLPETLGPTDVCDTGQRYADPFSGQPYVYRVLGPNTYLLCAEFEDAERIADRGEPMLGRFEEGCFTVTAGRRGLPRLPLLRIPG